MNHPPPEPALQSIADALVTAASTAAAAAFAGTPVFLAYAFGSRVWGSARPSSDLDIGYYVRVGPGTVGVTTREEMLLAGALSESLGCEVDLRNLAYAPLALRGRVLEEGRRIYCTDEVARVNLERDLLGCYHDAKPELEAMRRLRFAALASQAR